MTNHQRTLLAVFLAIGLAATVTVASFYYYPTPLSRDWLIATGTFFAIGVVSKGLALQMTESGTLASMDFLPQLGALLTVGPTGAITMTALYESIAQFALLRKPPVKATYNTAQLTVSIGLSALAFQLAGGSYSVESLDFTGNLVPFLVAAAVYFTVNKAAVSYIISVSERERIKNVWQEISQNVLAVDVAISPIAILLAFLYIRWGALATILSMVPLIGLRYSYGVIIELQHLNRDLLRVLIKTIETQDPYTSGHSLRVAERARRIARELNLGRKTTRTIETAALLHDVGKIDKDYRDILQQSGPLSPEQRQLIKEHPERGVALLESIRSLDEHILKAVKHHHERFDGTGYPSGLHGKNIPLGARIIMVSDTIDAMMTTRPYRDAASQGEIRDELRDCAGTQFDPDIVEAALSAGVVESIDVEEDSP